jgi:nucleoside-diphosphate-sugar epimerase
VTTVLLTGAAGFIGARTAHLLLDRGCRVIGVDNLNDYYDVRLKEHRLQGLDAREGFRFVRGDIENPELVDSLFLKEHPDVVLNLAARAGVRYSMVNPRVYMTTNAMGTLNLLEAMRHHRVGKLVLASTSSLYAGQAMPFAETLPVNTPVSPYAASKKAAEVMAYSYHYLHGIDVSVVRYFTVYGPAGRPDMSVFRFIRWIDDGVPIELFGDGNQARDFTYVDDIAAGTVAAMKPLGFEVVNLGGGNQPVSMLDMIAILEELLGKKATLDRQPMNKADVPATWADIAKADRLFGWRPEVSLRDGLARTVEWYLANREWVRQVTL